MLGFVLAAQIAIVARGPDSAQICVPLELSIAARAPGVVAPRITLPATNAVQLLRATLSSRVERDASGQSFATTQGVLTLATGSAGHVVLPPLVVTAGGATARSSPTTVDVAAPDVNTPVVLVRASLEAPDGRPVDSVLVGEQVDYVVDVQLNETARQRLRRNPTFFSPDMPSVLAFDLPAPAPLGRDTHRCFETLSYRRALFPLFPGTARIPPAVLTYSLPLSTSFFSREESYELRTDGVEFTALEPPAAGRPSDYIGAVGTLQAGVQLGTSSARMGDPVVLTLRLQGAGNVKLLPRPTITLPWATVALGEERVTLDTSSAVVRGVKEFDWLLTARRAGRLVVPPIRYPFFNPGRRAYELTVTDSLAIDVAPATLASADTSTAPRLPIRTVLRGERGPDLPSHAWYWGLLLIAPAPAAVRRLRSRRRYRRAGVSPIRRLRTLGAARTPPAPRELRRAYLDALRERVPSLGDAASRLSLGRALRYAGVTEATAHRAELLLERLDAAAFSPAGRVERELAQHAVSVAAAVDAEAVRPTRRVTSVVLLTALLLGVQAIAMPDGVVRAFTDGVRAYERGELAAAQRLFARTAARAPRAEDAWANLGTVAWTRGDSAHAALGWQRALRLDPLDDEVRERLGALQPSVLGAAGYVPPIAVSLLAGGALGLWLAAWLALALPAAWRPAHLRALAGGAIVLAVASLAGALELHGRADARGLGVVRAGRELLGAPLPSASPAAAVAAGEVGALGAREGAWVRIRVDGARAGWIPVAAILPLDGGGAD